LVLLGLEEHRLTVIVTLAVFSSVTESVCVRRGSILGGHSD